MIRINIGANPRQDIGSDWTEVEIPIRLDMSEAEGKNLGSLQMTLSFDPSRFAFVREQAGKAVGWQAVANTQQANLGIIVVAGFGTRGVRQSSTLHVITLRPLFAGSASIEGVVDIAADENARRFDVPVRNLEAVIQ